MTSMKVLALASLVAAAHSSPTLTRRQDPPAPSPFPLGAPCMNEWQYLNFDPNVDIDRQHLQKLHDAICLGEMRAISSHASLSARNSLAPYFRYFGDDDESKENVAEVMELISGTATEEIGEVVGSFVIDNLDFGSNGGEVDCSDGTLAYTLVDTLDNREKIHFCDPAWTRGTSVDVDCNALDPFPSTKMDSFARIALHEMTHYSSVGPATSLGVLIVDQINDDDEYAYDPQRVHGLIAQDDQPGKAENNADSYAWLAAETFTGHHCLPDAPNYDWAGFFTQDPPPY